MRHRSEDMQQPVATALVWWCCTALFSIGVFPCRAGCDTWVKSVGNGTAPIYDGFGSVSNMPANKGVEWLRVFNGFIYAAVGQEESGSGNPLSVWRSSDLTNWTQVGAATFGTNDLDSFSIEADGSAHLFMGTQVIPKSGGANVYVSTDGSTWSLFNPPGSGFNRVGALWALHMTVGAGNLFVNLMVTGGTCVVLKRPVDGSAQWTTVQDFSSGLGMLDSACTNYSITYLYFISNTIFMAASRGTNACLFQSTDAAGTNWSANTMVGNGFGDTNNLNLASLIEYNGFLYATVHNAATGGQLWRTPLANALANGAQPWTQVVSNGFDQGSRIAELHHIAKGIGHLWVSTLGLSAQQRAQVWRSADGTNWLQSNMDGFVDYGKAAGRSPVVEVFNGHAVWGGGTTLPNAGAQVWFTSALGSYTSAPPYIVDYYDPSRACNGTTLFADDHWSNGLRIVQVNMAGDIVWQYIVPDGLKDGLAVASDAALLTNGTIMVLLAGKGLFEINRHGDIVWSNFDGRIDHSFERLPNGNTLYSYGDNDDVGSAVVKEVTTNGTRVWSWFASNEYFSVFPTTDTNIARGGWTHVNAASRMTNGHTLINLRNFDRTIEVDTNGTVVWSVDYTNLYPGTFPVGYDPHEPELQTNDHLLVCLQWTTPYQVVEFDRATCLPEWEYNRPCLRTTRDADRLPNGNTLIVGVVTNEPWPDFEQSVMFEVTPSKEIVWQLRLPTPSAFNVPGWFYKAQRIADADQDGLDDGTEGTLGTNPNKADTDDDGLSDLAEVMRGTNPLDWDTDDDTQGDGIEVHHGTDPLDPASFVTTLAGVVTNTAIPGCPVCIVAVSDQASWNNVYGSVIPVAGAYIVSNVPTLTSYWVKAFTDINSNGVFDPGEYNALHEPDVFVTNAMSGLDIMIVPEPAMLAVLALAGILPRRRLTGARAFTPFFCGR